MSGMLGLACGRRTETFCGTMLARIAGVAVHDLLASRPARLGWHLLFEMSVAGCLRNVESAIGRNGGLRRYRACVGIEVSRERNRPSGREATGYRLHERSRQARLPGRSATSGSNRRGQVFVGDGTAPGPDQRRGFRPGRFAASRSGFAEPRSSRPSENSISRERARPAAARVVATRPSPRTTA